MLPAPAAGAHIAPAAFILAVGAADGGKEADARVPDSDARVGRVAELGGDVCTVTGAALEVATLA